MASETTDSTDLLIAGLVHRIPWPREHLRDFFGAHYLQFIVDRVAQPDLTIVEVPESAQMGFRPDETLHDAEGILTWSSRFAAIRFDAGAARCEILTANPPHHAGWVLRFITGALLSHRDGLLVHAAGLVHDNRGFLYIGPSGAGKSTLARIAAARGGTILCDESVAVRFCDDSVFVYATPYTIERKWIGAAGSAPLDAIFYLDRSLPLGAAPVSPARVVSILAKSIFFKLTAEPLTSRFLLTATHLATARPIVSLSYRLDAAPWPPPITLR